MAKLIISAASHLFSHLLLSREDHNQHQNLLKKWPKHEQSTLFLSSVCRLAESACIQAPPWAELIYVAAQPSKPRVRSHTVLQGAVWLEMGERNHALTRPAIWFSLHTCMCAHPEHTLTPSHVHPLSTHTYGKKKRCRCGFVQSQTCSAILLFTCVLRNLLKWWKGKKRKKRKNATGFSKDIYGAYLSRFLT